MPSPTGQHVIRVAYRSANVYGTGKYPLRPAGRIVFTGLRGKDFAGIQQVDMAYDPNGQADSLDSFGNTETIPPYTLNGVSYPLGRVLRGSIPTFAPDPSFTKMLNAQAVQPMVTIDTSWLLVGHVDETISFIPANTPRGWKMLVNDPALAKTDKSSVRFIGVGSAPASPALFEALHRAFPNAAASNGYGVTEAGPVMFANHPAGKPRPATSIGYPLAGCEIRLDPGPDEGVLLTRNPGVMAAYHNLPEETARRLKDGWFDTSDVCRRDADGFYYFVGRTDDMFVCGGENVYPGDVEGTLERHPDVLQAAVLPVDHELKGQVPVAFVVARAGSGLTEQDVKEWALAHGPAYQHPRRVFLVPELPLAGTNKIDRAALRARALAVPDPTRGG